MMPKISIGDVFLAVCFVTLSITITKPVMHGTVDKSFGGQFQFLTIVSLTLTTLTLFGSRLQWNREVLSHLLVISTVLGTLVSLFYWSLYFYEKSLIYHPNLPTIPLIYDLALHLLPAIAIWNQLLSSEEYHFSTRNILMIAGFAIFYQLWVEACFKMNDYYPYPFFAKMSLSQKVFLVVFSSCIGTLVYSFTVYIKNRLV